MKIEKPSCTVTIDDTPEMREEVFKRVVGFFVEHEVFSGESVMQCDAPQLAGPEFLADMVDEVLKPDVEWHDE